MSQPPDLESRSDPRELENARAGYAAAVSLWIHEGSGIWSKFTGMVYAHTILILTIGVLLGSGHEAYKVFRVALCVFGLVLSVFWLLLTVRSFVYHDHYVVSAREIERRYLLPGSDTVTKGATLLAKDARVSILARFAVRSCIYAVIAVFAVIYAWAALL